MLYSQDSLNNENRLEHDRLLATYNPHTLTMLCPNTSKTIKRSKWRAYYGWYSSFFEQVWSIINNIEYNNILKKWLYHWIKYLCCKLTIMNFRIGSVLLATIFVTLAYQQHGRIQNRKALHHYGGLITAVKNSCKDNSDCSRWAECNNTKCVCKKILQKLRTVHCEENLQLSVIRCHCVTYDNNYN